MLELIVDTTNPTPPYEQLRRQLADLITGGALPPGERLPPLRQLAGDLGLAVGTVARTYRELETAGLITSRRGGGTRVAPNPAANPAADPAAAAVAPHPAGAGPSLSRTRLSSASGERVGPVADGPAASRSSMPTGGPDWTAASPARPDPLRADGSPPPGPADPPGAPLRAAAEAYVRAAAEAYVRAAAEVYVRDARDRGVGGADIIAAVQSALELESSRRSS